MASQLFFSVSQKEGLSESQEILEFPDKYMKVGWKWNTFLFNRTAVVALIYVHDKTYVQASLGNTAFPQAQIKTDFKNLMGIFLPITLSKEPGTLECSPNQVFTQSVPLICWPLSSFDYGASTKHTPHVRCIAMVTITYILFTNSIIADVRIPTTTANTAGTIHYCVNHLHVTYHTR